MRDAELQQVLERFAALDPEGVQFSRVIRETFDQLYDGAHTGHYRPDQLRKTEKTHCGSLVEINLQRALGLNNGDDMDYKVAGVDVDCKFSMYDYQWMLPRESVNHICLVITADEHTSKWSAGVVRVTEERLNRGKNQDSKRTLNVLGRESVEWLFRKAPYPENTLLHLPQKDVLAISGAGGGTQRVAELFRRTEGRAVWRGVVATVGQQLDYMKRVRRNGGARDILTPEGYFVLAGHKPGQRAAAEALRLPAIGPGEFVAVRVVEAEHSFGGSAAEDRSGRRWRRALAGEPASQADAHFD